MNTGHESKLKQAAELYAKREGETLLAETEEIRRQNVSYFTPRADKTVAGLISKSKQPMRRKMLYSVCAAAACVVIITSLVLSQPDVSPASSAPSAPSEPSAPSPLPAEQAEILPISFVLPADYRVTETDLDNGMSIYSLESDRHGDVVLTMYYEDDKTDAGDDIFDEIIIDGKPVSAKVMNSYMLLVFEKDGLNYTLSSRDDLGSLAAFYRNIMEAVPA